MVRDESLRRLPGWATLMEGPDDSVARVNGCFPHRSDSMMLRKGNMCSPTASTSTSSSSGDGLGDVSSLSSVSGGGRWL
jgi:hypothetical protein